MVEPPVTLPDLPEEQAEFYRAKIFRLLGNAQFRTALATLGARKRCSGTPVAPETAARLMDIVPFFAAVAVAKGGTAREDRERIWALGTGKTWKALTEFPGRLREMAKEIKRLEGSAFFNPESAITSKKPLAIFAKRQFLYLPVTLQRYADWVEASAKQIPALTQQHYPSRPRGYSAFVGYVSEMAWLITGRLCDSEVAELLNAADLVLNPGDPRSGLRFDAQTLRDLRSRQKRKLPRR